MTTRSWFTVDISHPLIVETRLSVRHHRTAEARMKSGINTSPTTVLLDSNGIVGYVGIGAGVEES